MTCVSFLLFLNGEPGDLFFSSRGLRQGDPISPYLFLLVMERLYRRLAWAVESKEIHIPPFPRGTSISHLFFADDVLLFCQANWRTITKLANILSSFTSSSGGELSKISNHSLLYISD